MYIFEVESTGSIDGVVVKQNDKPIVRGNYGQVLTWLIDAGAEFGDANGPLWGALPKLYTGDCIHLTV